MDGSAALMALERSLTLAEMAASCAAVAGAKQVNSLPMDQ
jgi:hypothetical protein